MAEAMAVESIIDSYWQTENCWTKVRFPYRSEDGNAGGWSDVDIVAYNPNNHTLVLCESKAHGNKDAIKTLESVLKDSEKFRTAIPIILANDKFKFLNPKTIIIHIVANIHQEDEFEINYNYKDKKYYRNDLEVLKKESYENSLKEIIAIRGLKIPESVISIKLEVQSLFTVFNKILENIKLTDKKKKIAPQEKRFGNPVLDIAREINRYLSVTNSKKGDHDYLKVKKTYELFFKTMDINIFKLCKHLISSESELESEIELLNQLLIKYPNEAINFNKKQPINKIKNAKK